MSTLSFIFILLGVLVLIVSAIIIPPVIWLRKKFLAWGERMLENERLEAISKERHLKVYTLKKHYAKISKEEILKEIEAAEDALRKMDGKELDAEQEQKILDDLNMKKEIIDKELKDRRLKAQQEKNCKKLEEKEEVLRNTIWNKKTKHLFDDLRPYDTMARRSMSGVRESQVRTGKTVTVKRISFNAGWYGFDRHFKKLESELGGQREAIRGARKHIIDMGSSSESSKSSESSESTESSRASTEEEW